MANALASYECDSGSIPGVGICNGGSKHNGHVFPSGTSVLFQNNITETPLYVPLILSLWSVLITCISVVVK